MHAFTLAAALLTWTVVGSSGNVTSEPTATGTPLMGGVTYDLSQPSYGFAYSPANVPYRTAGGAFSLAPSSSPSPSSVVLSVGSSSLPFNASVFSNGTVHGVFPRLPDGNNSVIFDFFVGVAAPGQPDLVLHTIPIQFELIPPLSNPFFSLPSFTFSLGFQITPLVPFASSGVVRKWENVTPFNITTLGLMFDPLQGAISGTPHTPIQTMHVSVAAYDAGSDAVLRAHFELNVVQSLSDITYNDGIDLLLSHNTNIEPRTREFGHFPVSVSPVVKFGKSYQWSIVLPDFGTPQDLPLVFIDPVTGTLSGLVTSKIPHSPTERLWREQGSLNISAVDYGAANHKEYITIKTHVVPKMSTFSYQSMNSAVIGQQVDGTRRVYVQGEVGLAVELLASVQIGYTAGFSVLGGAMPQGLSLNSSTGDVVGIPTQLVPTNASVTVAAYDAGSTYVEHVELVFHIVWPCNGAKNDKGSSCADLNRDECSPIDPEGGADVCGRCMVGHKPEDFIKQNGGTVEVPNSQCVPEANPMVFAVVSGTFVVLVLVILLFLHSRSPSANNVAVVSVFIALFDIFTDVLFVSYVMDSDNFSTIRYFAIAFVVAPIIFNMVVCSVLIKREMEYGPFVKWFGEHSLPVTMVIALATTSTDVLVLLNSRILGLPVFDAPFTDKTAGLLRFYGLGTLFLEDLPQFVLQIVVVNTLQNNNVRTPVTVWMSLVASMSSIIFSLFRRLFHYFYFKAMTKQETDAMFINAMGDAKAGGALQVEMIGGGGAEDEPPQEGGIVDTRGKPPQRHLQQPVPSTRPHSHSLSASSLSQSSSSSSTSSSSSSSSSSDSDSDSDIDAVTTRG